MPNITRLEPQKLPPDTTTTTADIANCVGYRANSANTPLFLCNIAGCNSSFYRSRDAFLTHRNKVHPGIPLDASQVSTYPDALPALLAYSIMLSRRQQIGTGTNPSPSPKWPPAATRMTSPTMTMNNNSTTTTNHLPQHQGPVYMMQPHHLTHAQMNAMIHPAHMHPMQMRMRSPQGTYTMVQQPYPSSQHLPQNPYMEPFPIPFHPDHTQQFHPNFQQFPPPQHPYPQYHNPYPHQGLQR